MSFKIALFTMIIFGIFISTVYADNTTPNDITTTNTNTTIYKTFVTDGLGFYKVRNLDVPPRHFTYENHVLNINNGDTVIWENDADVSTFTIVSEQNLWNNQIGQIKVGNKINYKFDTPGIYTFYIKEISSKRQTIVVVGSTGDIPNEPTIPTQTISPTPIENSPTPTENSPTPTDTFPIHKAEFNQTSIDHQIDNNTFNISIPFNIPIKITATTIASMIVTLLSIYIAFKTGKK